MGTAPVITAGDLLLAESGAIVDDIIAKHGGGRLARGPADPDFAQYLYWYHFANASLQPVMGRNMILRRLNLPADNPVLVYDALYAWCEHGQGETHQWQHHEVACGMRTPE